MIKRIFLVHSHRVSASVGRSDSRKILRNNSSLVKLDRSYATNYALDRAAEQHRNHAHGVAHWGSSPARGRRYDPKEVKPAAMISPAAGCRPPTPGVVGTPRRGGVNCRGIAGDASRIMRGSTHCVRLPTRQVLSPVHGALPRRNTPRFTGALASGDAGHCARCARRCFPGRT
jgi:hypothetical protein